MTDAAVADGGAPAPAPTGAPVPDNAVSPGNPISSTGPTVEPEAEKPSGTPQEAIQRATAKVAAKNAEKEAGAKVDPKAEPKADAKDAKEPPARGENGKFAAKDPAKAAPAEPVKDAAKPADPVKPSHTAEDAPARFTETAKAKWHAADPEIRGEVLRMQRELTDGFQKYKQAAERDTQLNEFHEMAQKGGTTVKEALSRYVGIENKLRSDLLGGLDEIISNATQGKLSLREIAAHVMGQTPEQNASQQDTLIRELRHELSTLKQQVTGVTQTIQQQTERATMSEIQKFAADHTRFDELANDIAFFMQSGRAKDLAEAYELAERLNPAAPVASAPPATPAKADPPPLNPAGSKSIAGAPSSGSTPVIPDNRPVPTIEESLKRALAKSRAA